MGTVINAEALIVKGFKDKDMDIRQAIFYELDVLSIELETPPSNNEKSENEKSENLSEKSRNLSD